MKPRNPIANAVKKIRPKVVLDKRVAVREKELKGHYIYTKEGD